MLEVYVDGELDDVLGSQPLNSRSIIKHLKFAGFQEGAVESEDELEQIDSCLSGHLCVSELPLDLFFHQGVVPFVVGSELLFDLKQILQRFKLLSLCHLGEQ